MDFVLSIENTAAGLGGVGLTKRDLGLLVDALELDLDRRERAGVTIADLDSQRRRRELVNALTACLEAASENAHLDGLPFKSHAPEAIAQALEAGLAVYVLDTGNDGEDDTLIGSEEEIRNDILTHHDLDALPAHWTLSRVEVT